MKKFFGMALLASGLSFGAAAFAAGHEKAKGEEKSACTDHCEKCTHEEGATMESCSNKDCDCQKHGHKHDHKHDHKKDKKKSY